MRHLIPLALLLGLVCLRAESQEKKNAADPSTRLRAMRAIAETVTVQTDSPEGRQKEEQLPDPVSRFNDPARRFSDGTVWAWGRSGRPVALLTLSTERTLEGEYRWLGELTSLAPVPLVSYVPGSGAWAPSVPGVEPKNFLKAPAPGDSEAKRLRQMKELARRFKAFEFFAPRNRPTTQRYELRLLPQPIHRYADPKSGLIDGVIFFFTYGTNPEIAVLIEARRQGTSEPAWSFGLARIAGAQLHVELDEKEVWTRPKHFGSGAREPYWVFVKPMAPEDRPENQKIEEREP